MLLANQITGFLSCNISTIGVIKLIFLHAFTYMLKLQIDDMILGGRAQACPKRLLKFSGPPFSHDLFIWQRVDQLGSHVESCGLFFVL